MIFSVTPILREINLWDSRSGKYAILPHLETEFGVSLIFALFGRLEFIIKTYLITPKMAETAVLERQASTKLISRKI